MRISTMLMAGALCAVAPASAAELIINGGFESGTFNSQ